MGPLRMAELALAESAAKLAVATDAILDMNNSQEDRENKLWLAAMVSLSEYNMNLKQVDGIKAELPWME